MEQQKQFAHGLLYSVPPENFPSLHLRDEKKLDGFEWAEFNLGLTIRYGVQEIMSFLKMAAARRGIFRN